MQTNWYVIAGPPSSGKTALVNELAVQGYSVLPESARKIIDEELMQGKVLPEIRSNVLAFQRKVVAARAHAENALQTEGLAFLDTAVPCSAAYCRMENLDPAFVYELAGKKRYKGVFLLDALPEFEQDYARIEDRETALALGRFLFEVYTGLEYEVISVPALPVQDRAQFVLERVLTGKIG